MTTEERILSYLDGSLGEEESAELMHQLSVSPENRVILEQHIKLSELTRVVQKPYDVPAMLEASLAERIPVLAGESAATSTVRNSSLLSSSLLALRQYPVRFALGGLITLIAGGALSWFALTDTNPSLDAQRQLQNLIPEAIYSASEHSSATPTPLSSHSQPSRTTTESLLSAQRSTRPSAVSQANDIAAHELRDHKTSALSLKDHTSIGANINHNLRQFAFHHERDNDGTIAAITDNMHSTSSQTMDEPTPPSGIFQIPSAPIRAESHDLIAFVGQSPRLVRVSDVSPMSTFERSNWALRLSGGLGSTFLYVPSGGNALASRTEGSVIGGIDYRLSQTWGVGLELGTTSNQTLSPSSTIVSAQGISRIETHATSTTSTSLFVRGALRYCFNPYDQFRIEVSGGGGRLLSTPAWMAQAQAGVRTSIAGFDAMEFQAFVLYSGVWSNATTAATTETQSVSEPIEYSTQSIPSATIYTPAITIRAGIQYRLP